MRYSILLIFCAASAGADVIEQQANHQKLIVDESDATYLFDSVTDAEKFNSKNCYNVYVDESNLKKIKWLLEKEKEPKITTKIVKNFFNRKLYDTPNTSIFFHYHGKPIDDFCQREDLVIIKSVKEE